MTSSSESDPAPEPVESVPRSPLWYLASLPERLVRSGVGLASGALRESAALLVPQSFQSSTTYNVLIRQSLDFLTEDVGGVARSKPAQESTPENAPQQFLARKAVGNFLDMASLATLHISPLMILAIVSDMAYGSKTYLHELAAELKSQGVIDEQSTIDKAGDLLAAVSKASSITSQAFNTPPISVAGLQQTISETRDAVAEIDPKTVIPQEEIRRLWQEMRDVADREGVDLLAVSGAVTMQSLGKIGTLGRGALSGVKVAGRLFDRHVLDSYAQSIDRIRDEGLYNTLARTSQPYVTAVWENFSANRSTLTEDVLSGKLVGGAWHAVRNWLGGKPVATAALEPKLDEPAKEPV